VHCLTNRASHFLRCETWPGGKSCFVVWQNQVIDPVETLLHAYTNLTALRFHERDMAPSEVTHIGGHRYPLRRNTGHSRWSQNGEPSSLYTEGDHSHFCGVNSLTPSQSLKTGVSTENCSDTRAPHAKSFLQNLGPGLITGTSDDDPSGIATYSKSGAQFGYGMLWVMLFSYPLMCAIQEISARIGRVTGHGIAGNMRLNSRPIVRNFVVLLLCLANILNLGADFAAMGASSQQVVGGPALLYVVFFALLSLFLQMFVRYTTYVKYLKWLTIVVFAYVVTAFFVHIPWAEVLRSTFVPSVTFSRNFFAALTAVLGTTISPYLFFWQASQEAEEVRVNADEHPLKRRPEEADAQFCRVRFDTYFGMGVSNLVAFFIILTTAATLHEAGILDVQTAAQAAKALEPIAGRFASLLFAAGIVGTGLLAVPVLAGSAAYGVAEAFRWRASLQKKPRQAPRFYGILAVATLLGLALNFLKIDPLMALFWSAVINGVVAVPVMVITMILASSPKVMGQFALPSGLRVAGWVATAVMAIVCAGLFATL
jgi:NRAMP (natural resistance-associated macrophage protein)-like metal ion transporter